MNSNTHTLQHYRRPRAQRLRAQRQTRSPYIKGMFTPPPLTHDNFLIYSITALGSGCSRPRPQHASCAPRGLAATGRGFARACGSPLQAGHVWADIASVSNIATNTPPSGRTFFRAPLPGKTRFIQIPFGKFSQRHLPLAHFLQEFRSNTCHGRISFRKFHQSTRRERISFGKFHQNACYGRISSGNFIQNAVMGIFPLGNLPKNRFWLFPYAEIYKINRFHTINDQSHD